MATMTGMDIAAVRALAKQLKSGATEIDQITKKLTAKLESTPWVGNDQKRFLSDWKGSHTSALRKVADGLTDASQKAETNAREQEDVSNR